MKATLLIALVACAASQRTQTIDDVYTATLAAGSAFTAFDAAHANGILAAGLNKSTVDAQLASWYVVEARVVKAFVAVFDAIDAARKVNTDASVSTVVAAAAALTAELKADGVVP